VQVAWIQRSYHFEPLSAIVYDPAVNPLYRDMPAQYGAVAMPCRIRDPYRRGKVESGVGHA
jgi:hypothetical protein